MRKNQVIQLKNILTLLYLIAENEIVQVQSRRKEYNRNEKSPKTDLTDNFIVEAYITEFGDWTFGYVHSDYSDFVDVM